MSVPHVRVPRSEMEQLDPVWSAREPFDSRSARLFLRNLAAYKEQDTVIDGKPVRLLPGDFVASERWLAERWGWSRSRVTRFLKKLEEAHWLQRTSSEPAVCKMQGHLTICDIRAYVDLRSEIEPAADKKRTKVKERVIQLPTEVEGQERARVRATRRVPKDWKPTSEEEQALRSLADESGVDFDLELASMRDWEFQNPRSDWVATARNWLRKAGTHHGKHAMNGNGRKHVATGQVSTPDDAVAAAIVARMQG